MKICILIPSFNEERTIGWLVKTVLEYGYDVFVIDDGSSDKTAKLAQENGANVIINESNMGKGASLRKAFKLLMDKNYDAFIIMDGDGQHLPEDLVYFVKLFEKERPGIIVGNRMIKPKGMPLIRWLTNKFMSFVLSKMCRQDVFDSQCGFRLVDMNVLKKLRLSTEKFEIESEMLIEAASNGFRIESVPITTIYSGQNSAIHPVKDTIRFFQFVFKKR
ncbi:MAG: glycosyltransferase family 2 protein [Candidatus Omnitrophota bacterium]